MIALGTKSLSTGSKGVIGMDEKRKNSSFCAEMDPTLLPAIIKKGSSMMEENAGEKKCRTWKEVFSSKQVIGTIVGLVLAVVVMCLPLNPEKPAIAKTFGLLLIMATCWVTEILPLAVAALFPVVICPLFNIADAKTIAVAYFNDTIFMFMAGFLISLAMEKWNLHIRIALFITSFFSSPRSILFGVMFASYFLSMWISNTAASLMMVANITALVETLEDHYGRQKMAKFSKAIMIGIAFACNIGGFATLIGTPPNMTFSQVFTNTFHNADNPTGAPEISFSSWLFAVWPTNILLFLITWAFFAYCYCPSKKELEIDANYCKEEYKKLGKASYEEKVVFIAFILVAFLWLFRGDMNLGSFTIPGWSNIFGSAKGKITDATVGMTICLLLFFIPTKKSIDRTLEEGDHPCILTWETAKKIPWDLVLLFGGGFALAEACTISGVSVWIGDLLRSLGSWPRFLAILVISVVVMLVTNFTSNTATASIMMPVMVGIAQQTKINPLLLMVPVALACSCAFLLPVGTPPNLVVFASNRLTINDMIIAGAAVSVLSLVAIMVITFVMLPAVYGIDIQSFPDWAMPKA